MSSGKDWAGLVMVCVLGTRGARLTTGNEDFLPLRLVVPGFFPAFCGIFDVIADESFAADFALLVQNQEVNSTVWEL